MTIIGKSVNTKISSPLTYVKSDVQMAEYQVLFNAAFSVILLGIGWLMRTIFETTRDLRNKDQDIYDKVSDLAVTIPENYVHKSDFRELNERIFDKLDRIENKLDTKVDK